MARLAILAILAISCSGCVLGLPVMMVGAIAGAPFMTQVPNSGCYILDKNFEQRRPCKPEETR